MELGLENKTVLITGGSRGIGYAAAERFAAEGCALRLVSRNADSLAQARSSLQGAHGVPVETMALDMRAEGAIEQLVERFGAGVDVLVNNAGDIPHGTLLEVDASRWRTAWDLKVYGYIDLTRAIYRRMQAQRHGVILNIIGMAGGEGVVPEYIAGSAGNAALVAFTRALGALSPNDGIRVVGVNPGMIATDRQIVRWRQRAQEAFGDPDRWRELTTHLPFGRLGEPAEIGSTLVFLASKAASYISGTTVTVDGGVSQRRAAR
jgi:NAD(P)-dependent dehydrogenase (short-subunit alcohol dehydrogenase family)